MLLLSSRYFIIHLELTAVVRKVTKENLSIKTGL